MNAENLMGFAAVVGFTAIAGTIAFWIFKKVKASGVEDDMAFRLIGLIGSFGALYIANLFREQLDDYSINEFIFIGITGAILLVGLYTIFVLLTTVGTKLKELGLTKIWKKLLYSAVISSVAAWGATALGFTEAVTLAKVAIGGALIFSVQLFG